MTSGSSAWAGPRCPRSPLEEEEEEEEEEGRTIRVNSTCGLINLTEKPDTLPEVSGAETVAHMPHCTPTTFATTEDNLGPVVPNLGFGSPLGVPP